jgi:hypothetical protein
MSEMDNINDEKYLQSPTGQTHDQFGKTGAVSVKATERLQQGKKADDPVAPPDPSLPAEERMIARSDQLDAAKESAARGGPKDPPRPGGNDTDDPN